MQSTSSSEIAIRSGCFASIWTSLGSPARALVIRKRLRDVKRKDGTSRTVSVLSEVFLFGLDALESEVVGGGAHEGARGDQAVIA